MPADGGYGIEAEAETIHRTTGFLLKQILFKNKCYGISRRIMGHK